jgi:hypothetical protein
MSALLPKADIWQRRTNPNGILLSGSAILGHGLLDRVNQLMFRKRLMQKRNATCIECLPMQDLIIEAGHENYRKLRPAGLQMMPQINARRASKLNVQ